MKRRIVPGGILALSLAVIVVAVPAAGAAGQGEPQCGDTITADTTLHKDLIDCPNNGIVIGADNITLDLNGHTIDGGNCVLGERCDGVVNLGHDGVTVRHGSIRQFGRGVVFGHVRHNRLLGISASRNPTNGISLRRSSRILVRNCSANHTTDNDTAALLLLVSHHVRILNSSFRHNTNLGIDIFTITHDSNNILIKGNVFVRNRDEAILMTGLNGSQITHSQITHNRVVQKNGGGITLAAGSHNVISRNHVVHAHDGIRIEKGHGNLVAHNVVAHARVDDFLVWKARHSLLKGNVARRAGDDGFDVNDGSTKLTKNRAVRNHDLGIEAVRGVIDGGGNVARHNGDPRRCTHVACS